MITFLLGRPGSGKSYYAVDKIFNNFSTSPNAVKDKKFKYDICYTNINEFNFDKVKNVFLLDFEDLKSKIVILHTLYKKKSTDEELIEKCIEFKIYHCLFVIDEAHNFFDTRDSSLVWWLSYHRHLYHEIILITQNISLIESKYKSFSEFFYEARPVSLTLDKRYFFYSVYCSSRLSKSSKSGVIKLKRNSEVFELYQSGDSVGASNVILKILFVAFLFFLVAFSVFYYYSSSLKSANNSSSSAPAVTNNKNLDYLKTDKAPLTKQVIYGSSSVSSDFSADYSDKKLFFLTCSLKECVNKTVSIPLPLLNKFISNKNIKVLYQYQISKTYSKYYLESSNSFYNFLNQTNEGVTSAINTNFSSIVPNINGK